MTVFKSGDLVVLKSGGPTMTVDTVNTDIFDDDKITGILCVWFVGEKLQRVRFDPGAIEPAPSIAPALLEKPPPAAREAPAPQATGEYQAVLDDMVDAMNLPAEAPASRAAPKKPKPAQASKRGAVSGPTIIEGVGGSTIG
jgi:uncharacterized protein YodC (DUF2158 family)